MAAPLELRKIGIMVLAAGDSTRLGRPKQLLKDKNGVSFIRRITKLALTLSCQRVTCILGAHHLIIAKELADLEAQIVINDQWDTGIASSIKLGVHTVKTQDPDIKALLFLVCDQPFVDERVLTQLIQQYHKTKCPIIASAYKNVLGTPALFDQSLFGDLLQLHGDRGAGSVISKHTDKVAMIEFEEGIFDIDTQKDYDLYVS